ncbi:MAG TPA: NAD-dependent epimerase/dehydratase family protein, partial [Pirellulales bacterium]
MDREQSEVKRIVLALVTGATGCLGREIIRQLTARGDQVRALCRRADDLKLPNGSFDGDTDAPSEIAVADVRDAAAVDQATRGVEAVYHTAGLAGMWGSWKVYRDTNTIGTRNVIEACRRNGVRRLIYTSSPSVVFSETDQCGADESLPYTKRWLCHYPKSKALAEQQVLAANNQNGLKTCALRPHLIWGPGDRQLLPRLFRRAASGRLWRVGNGSNEIDIVYVDNAA